MSKSLVITSSEVVPVQTGQTGCATARRERDSALDFAKGALVLLMVGYHWANYFLSVEGYFYRYVRFITPSFIFISGYLIGRSYFNQGAAAAEARIGPRLFLRGLKLLGLFISLNLALDICFGGQRGFPWSNALLSVEGQVDLFVTGVRRSSFQVLLPIAYLFLCCAAVAAFTAGKIARNLFGGLFLLCILLDTAGMHNGYIQLVGAGFLGCALGGVRLPRVNGDAKGPIIFGALYLLHLLALSVWNVVYMVQVVSVLLNLLLLYSFGTIVPAESSSHRRITALGVYTLFAYLWQILILQLLRAIAGPFATSLWGASACLLVAFVLTILGVEALRWARHRSQWVDKVYRFLF